MDGETAEVEMDETEAFIEELAGELPTEESTEGSTEVEQAESTSGATSEQEQEETQSSEQTDEQPENWQERFSTEEKRRKDSQTAYNNEHQRRLQLEKELESLKQNATAKAEQEQSEQEADLLDKYREKFTEDPEEAVAFVTQELRNLQKRSEDRLRQEMQRIQEEAYQRELDRQEQLARKTHEDYDAIVTEYLAPKMEADPSLINRWRDSGGTAEAAYELGKKLKSYEDFEKNPDAYREQIKQELLAEIKSSNPQVGDTLAGDNSHKKKGEGKPVISLVEEDILEEIFGT